MPDPADHVPYYTSAETASAAGVSVDTLKNWVSRKPQVILMTQEEREEVGRGRPILFSIQRVIQVAITARVVSMGWQPRDATMLAKDFTDGGHDESRTPDGRVVRPARDPGQLYPDGTTLLVAYPGATVRSGPNVLHVAPDTPWTVVLRDEAAVVLNLNSLVQGVRLRLAEAKDAR